MDYSVIIPIHNESETINELYIQVKSVMDNLTGKYELIFVDDGSTDTSIEELKKLNSNLQGKHTIVSLQKKYGKATALQAGFDAACGKVIITLDGDLQNDPKDIPKLLEKINEGYDIAFGWRWKRRDSFSKLTQSQIASLIRHVTTRDTIHDVSCTISAMKSDVIKNIYLYSGLHRFFSYLVTKLGYKITEVKVTHHERKHGISKYGFLNRFFQGFADLLRVLFVDTKKLMKRFKSYEIKEVIRK